MFDAVAYLTHSNWHKAGDLKHSLCKAFPTIQEENSRPIWEELGILRPVLSALFSEACGYLEVWLFQRASLGFSKGIGRASCRERVSSPV